MNPLPNGLIVVAKRECPTCQLVEPLLRQLGQSGLALTVYSQDDPAYGAGLPNVIHDATLEASFRLGIEIVPTLIRVEDGREVERTYGWHRGDWQRISCHVGLGEALPELRPGCGSKTLEPGISEELEIRFGNTGMASRWVEIGDAEDPVEACFDRGWSDGLPVVAPTPARVLRMLRGTTRDPAEVLGLVPPDLAPCTVEKAAVNAVMAGCKPEYMPVVLAAVEAALVDAFGMHGLLCTTASSSPLVIVNGPIARTLRMNSGVNVLGQGNRANATIGRALQLVIRNVGGGRPGEIDMAAIGHPGKFGFCFPESEDSEWEPLSVERGHPRGTSTVTLFAADGVQTIIDQKSRTPESLVRTYALCLRTVNHPKLARMGEAVLVVAPDHGRVFLDAGWSKARLREELMTLMQYPVAEMLPGMLGIAEGIPRDYPDPMVPKFNPGGIHIVRAGGRAGMYTAIISGWANAGPMGSVTVTKEITT